MQLPKQIAVFGSFLTNAESSEFAMAEEIGCLLARKGFTVVCGGHGGIANPLAAGVKRGGGRVLGLSLAEAKYPERNVGMNPLITEKVEFNSISDRLEFFANSDAFIFFSGGIGTLSEFAFMWHSLQLGGDFDRPLVFVSEGWKKVLSQIRNTQMVKNKYYRFVHLCDRAKDAVAVVSNDYSLKYDDPRSQFYKEAVLFDLDGTLVESPAEEFVRLCENIGYFFQVPAVIDAFRKAGGCREASEDARGFHVKVFENLGVGERPATESADYVMQMSGSIPRLYDDVSAILRYFKENGLATGVVSSRAPLKLREILSAHDLSDVIDIVCPRDPPDERPTSQPSRGVVEAFNVRKDGIVYIGANFQDDGPVSPAVGIDLILLDRHLTPVARDAPFKIRSLRELRDIVRAKSHEPGT